MKENVRKIIAELAARGIQLPDGDIRLGGFGDSEALSNSLIDLIVAGTKRATSSLLWSWDFDNETLPRTGDVEIVLDWQGSPALILRTTRVDITPFDCVTADFAASEGEGDLSLTYWQNEHWRFFSEECRRIGRAADETMPIVCERFEVLHALTPTQ
ncbi:ASCH domain-containing protein [Paraburkholderia sp. Ac-20347]|nr:ASCH domain-containing protein [Paraburkholderia sp. Ac-20347]